MFPGQLHRVQRNLYSVVALIDPASPEGLRCAIPEPLYCRKRRTISTLLGVLLTLQALEAFGMHLILQRAFRHRRWFSLALCMLVIMQRAEGSPLLTFVTNRLLQTSKLRCIASLKLL